MKMERDEDSKSQVKGMGRKAQGIILSGVNVVIHVILTGIAIIVFVVFQPVIDVFITDFVNGSNNTGLNLLVQSYPVFMILFLIIAIFAVGQFVTPDQR